jgi:signal transduction histidine kinase
VNQIAVASQVSWPLQVVIAFTFAVPLVGMATRLRGPAATALAAGWLWTAFALCMAMMGALASPTDTPLRLTVLTSMLVGAVGGSVPAFANAVRSLGAERGTTWSSIKLRESLIWAFAFGTVHQLAVAFPWSLVRSASEFGITPGRVLLVGAYTTIVIACWSARQRVRHRFRRPLNVFAVATLVQLVRPFATVLFFANAGESAITDSRGVAFIVVSVFVTTVLGLACIYVALEEERAAVEASSAKLRDAAVRVERAQRLESIGRLATGVAHDYNNFLTIIRSGTDLARDRLADGERPLEELSAIDDAVERGVALTRQLLTFARQQPQEAVTFDAVGRLTRMLGLLERLVGRQASLQHAFPNESLQVHMDPTQFEQIVVNLVSNARHAFGEVGGRIELRLRTVTLDQVQSLDVDELEDGAYAELQVADTGRGIPAEALEHIFEPFFTTRAADGGTGLGLSTVHGIVRQAGGSITAESTQGRGTTMTVLLPIAGAADVSALHR